MVSSKYALIFGSLSILNLFASATPSLSTIQACQAIDAALPGRLSYPLELNYIAETQKYWSTALRDLVPACVVLPTSTAEVAAIVQILNEHPDVDFAVKSGGHDVNPGHGSIQDGILIAMRQISGATYDSTTGLAYVKPGGEWNDVIGDLAPYNVTVVGGRLGWCPPRWALPRLCDTFS
jgi:FAD/FMN-containing dehydrogenase